MKRYCLALDLKDDDQLIAEYESHHQHIWPEIRDSILGSGIVDMEIYRIGTRLFMIMETENSFSFESKSIADAKNPAVEKWEALMLTYQQKLPQAAEGEKWLLMKRIFTLME